jgi:hypothetical protein
LLPKLPEAGRFPRSASRTSVFSENFFRFVKFLTENSTQVTECITEDFGDLCAPDQQQEKPPREKPAGGEGRMVGPKLLGCTKKTPAVLAGVFC